MRSNKKYLKFFLLVIFVGFCVPVYSRLQKYILFFNLPRSLYYFSIFPENGIINFLKGDSVNSLFIIMPICFKSAFFFLKDNYGCFGRADIRKANQFKWGRLSLWVRTMRTPSVDYSHYKRRLCTREVNWVFVEFLRIRKAVCTGISARQTA